MAKIKTAVFPVAGRGTRFLPATKASPKEMLPIVDKPLIQYAAEEALAAGAEKLVFITGYAKRAIEDHFDTDHELEQELAAQGKRDLLEAVRGHRAVVCQLHLHPPAGAARPGSCGAVLARRRRRRAVLHSSGRRPDRRRGAVPRADGAGVQRAQWQRARRADRRAATETDKYGIVAAEKLDERVSRVKRIVEKPQPADAPSNLAVVGRYVLTPAIYAKLEKIGRGAGGEIQLTDGIAALLADEAGLRVRVRGQALRLRLEARLPRGDRRVRAEAREPWRPVRQLPRTPGRRPAAWLIAGLARRSRPCRRTSICRARRDAAFARGLGNQLPVYIERARNAELWDVEGRRFIDFGSGIAVLNTGHLHPQGAGRCGATARCVQPHVPDDHAVRIARSSLPRS